MVASWSFSPGRHRWIASACRPGRPRRRPCAARGRAAPVGCEPRPSGCPSRRANRALWVDRRRWRWAAEEAQIRSSFTLGVVPTSLRVCQGAQILPPRGRVRRNAPDAAARIALEAIPQHVAEDVQPARGRVLTHGAGTERPRRNHLSQAQAQSQPLSGKTDTISSARSCPGPRFAVLRRAARVGRSRRSRNYHSASTRGSAVAHRLKQPRRVALTVRTWTRGIANGGPSLPPSLRQQCDG